MAHRLLDENEASEYLGADFVPPATLRNWRYLQKGPRYIKLPNGRVRYRTDWLDQFLEKHSVNPGKAA